MTRPKRWFLAEDDDGAVVVKNNDGLVKKPNAIRPLGKILTVSLRSSECSLILAIVYFKGNQRRSREVLRRPC